ncbi:MAG: type IV secretion system protein [Acidiphilium sp.]|nr:type IV secretion system protein [Acidiphilium sp.]MDD4937156.1 type IV secretion system protein [Acidiphilium sp.]
MSLLDRFRGTQGVKSEDVQSYLEESRGLERSYLREVLRSRRNAWLVAGGATLGAFFCLAVLAVQIKESSQPVPPFILSVDKSTGEVGVVSVMKEHKESYGEITDQYWVAQYVIHRESYDWQTIQADYDATGLMSAPDVAADYEKIFQGDNARDKTLANKARITVTLEAPPLVDPSTSTATARFTTTLHWRNGQPDTVKHWIATIAYRYVDSPMKPRDRLINPLGFQVTSYRLDPELGSQN